jgi:phosphatidylglycerol:prolipoprotein diacylglycerol transferase
VHPFLHIGGLTLPTYGLSAAIGLLAGYALAHFFAGRTGVGKDDATTIYLVSLAGVLIGSRGLQLIVEWDRFSADPFGGLARPEGGVFYGALIGGMIAAAITGKVRGHGALMALDTVAPVYALGHGFGRLGCLLGGCCFGRPTDGFGFAFPEGSPAFNTLKAMDPSLIDGERTTPLIPTQLYEMGGELILCVILCVMIARGARTGLVFATYAGAYGVLRFVLEYSRYDPERGWAIEGVLSTSQLIALFAIVIAVATVVYVVRRGSPPRAQTD